MPKCASHSSRGMQPDTSRPCCLSGGSADGSIDSTLLMRQALKAWVWMSTSSIMGTASSMCASLQQTSAHVGVRARPRHQPLLSLKLYLEYHCCLLGSQRQQIASSDISVLCLHCTADCYLLHLVTILLHLVTCCMLLEDWLLFLLQQHARTIDTCGTETKPTCSLLFEFNPWIFTFALHLFIRLFWFAPVQ